MQHVTIKDIARLSGVSVATVSRALNDASEISEDTRDRVLRICREQGYRTNLLARSLISSRTNVLGLILPDISNLGFCTAARELGLAVRTVENPTSASTISSGYQMARSVLEQPFSQTAVFAASDAVALGMIQVADELGIPIPERLSVLGFDNIEYAALPNIRLSTLSHNSPTMARAAVHLLLELIDSDSRGEYTTKFITPTLIRRATCRTI